MEVEEFPVFLSSKWLELIPLVEFSFRTWVIGIIGIIGIVGIIGVFCGFLILLIQLSLSTSELLVSRYSNYIII